jgi:hypothetical protein
MNDVISDEDARCSGIEGEVYAIYAPSSALPIQIDLSAVRDLFNLRWFDPVNGGDLQIGREDTMPGFGVRGLGKRPHDDARDWVILLKLP